MSRAERQKLYQSARWFKARRRFLANNPNCIACGKQSTVVDHKYGHDANWAANFWNDSGWQPMCRSCHSRKTNLMDNSANGSNERRRHSGFLNMRGQAGTEAVGGELSPLGETLHSDTRAKKTFRQGNSSLPTDSVEYLTNKLLSKRVPDDQA